MVAPSHISPDTGRNASRRSGSPEQDEPDLLWGVVAIRSRRYRTASRWESPFIDAGIWLAALVATGLTVWYSLGPTPPSHGSDKDLHAVAYFVDAFAILLAVVWRPGA